MVLTNDTTDPDKMAGHTGESAPAAAAHAVPPAAAGGFRSVVLLVGCIIPFLLTAAATLETWLRDGSIILLTLGALLTGVLFFSLPLLYFRRVRKPYSYIAWFAILGLLAFGPVFGGRPESPGLGILGLTELRLLPLFLFFASWGTALLWKNPFREHYRRDLGIIFLLLWTLPGRCIDLITAPWFTESAASHWLLNWLPVVFLPFTAACLLLPLLGISGFLMRHRWKTAVFAVLPFIAATGALVAAGPGHPLLYPFTGIPWYSSDRYEGLNLAAYRYGATLAGSPAYLGNIQDSDTATAIDVNTGDTVTVTFFDSGVALLERIEITGTPCTYSLYLTQDGNGYGHGETVVIDTSGAAVLDVAPYLCRGITVTAEGQGRLAELQVFEDVRRWYRPFLYGVIPEFITWPDSATPNAISPGWGGGWAGPFSASWNSEGNLFDNQPSYWQAGSGELPLTLDFSFLDGMELQPERIWFRQNNGAGMVRHIQLLVSDTSWPDTETVFSAVGDFLLQPDTSDQSFPLDCGECRSIRLVILDTYDGNAPILAELRVDEKGGELAGIRGELPPAAISMVNIASTYLGGAVREVSSCWSSDYDKRFLVDGFNQPSYWGSAGDTDFPHAIDITFHDNRTATIAAVLLDGRLPREQNCLPTRVRLEVHAGDEITASRAVILPPTFDRWWIDFPDEPKGDMVRVLLTANRGANYTGLQEVEVYEAPGASILYDFSPNLLTTAAGGYVARFTAQNGGLASCAIEGSGPGHWNVSNVTFPQDIVFGFRDNRRVQFNRVEIDPVMEGDTANWVGEFKVEVSDQDALRGFRTVGRTDYAAGTAPMAIEVPPTTARFIKVRILNNRGGQRLATGAIRIFEPAGLGDASLLFGEGVTAEGQVATAGPQSLTLAGAPEVEPHDTMAQATALPPGQAITGTLYPAGDEDWFVIPGEQRTSAILNIMIEELPYFRTVIKAFGADGSDARTFEPTGVLERTGRFTWVLPQEDIYLKLWEPPARVVIIWDTSGSMSGREGDLFNALSNYIDSIREGDELMLIRFSDDVQVLTGFTSDTATLHGALQGTVFANGGTALYGALAEGLNRLRGHHGNHAIILMTDGQNSSSGPLYEDLWKQIAAEHVRLYTIGLGSALQTPYMQGTGCSGEQMLRNFAAATDGIYFFAPTSDDLAGVYHTVAQDMHQVTQYTLQVTEPPGDGTIIISEVGERIPGVSEPNRYEFVLDCSGSMHGKVRDASGTQREKIDVARDVLLALAAELPPDVEMSLRAFGHRYDRNDRERSFRDSELVVPFGPVNLDRLREVLSGINPQGQTPIGYSLSQVLDDLAGSEGEKEIILISDGKETADPDPGDEFYPAVMAGRLRENDIGVRVDVIGFDIGDAATRQLLQRIAESGGGGYIDAASPEELRASIKDKMSVPVEVIAMDGTVLARGYMGEAFQVPEGQYTVRIISRTPFEVKNVGVAANRRTEVHMDREGEEITSEIVISE